MKAEMSQKTTCMVLQTPFCWPSSIPESGRLKHSIAQLPLQLWWASDPVLANEMKAGDLGEGVLS